MQNRQLIVITILTIRIKAFCTRSACRTAPSCGVSAPGQSCTTDQPSTAELPTWGLRMATYTQWMRRPARKYGDSRRAAPCAAHRQFTPVSPTPGATTTTCTRSTLTQARKPPDLGRRSTYAARPRSAMASFTIPIGAEICTRWKPRRTKNCGLLNETENPNSWGHFVLGERRQAPVRAGPEVGLGLVDVSSPGSGRYSGAARRHGTVLRGCTLVRATLTRFSKQTSTEETAG